MGKQVGIEPLIIQGEELDKKGFGGSWKATPLPFRIDRTVDDSYKCMLLHAIVHSYIMSIPTSGITDRYLKVTILWRYLFLPI